MDNSGGIRASLAGRYASALFDLARDQRQIESVGKSLDALGQALLNSKDFNELVTSPLVSREEAGKAFAALAPQLGLDPITANFLGVLARNGRKGQLRSVIRAFRRLAAEHRGEATAEVVTARPLNDDQVAALKAAASRPRRPRRHDRCDGRSRTSSAESSSSWAASRSTRRSVPNSTVSLRR